LDLNQPNNADATKPFATPAKLVAFRGESRRLDHRPPLVKEIFQKNMQNLAAALNQSSGFHYIDVYDNRMDLTKEYPVRLMLSVQNGRATYDTEQVPPWLNAVLWKVPSLQLGKISVGRKPRKLRGEDERRGKRDQIEPERDDFDLDR
jgi:hypothetical protein